VRNLNSAARSSKGTHLWFCKIIVNKLSKRKKKKKKNGKKKKKKKNKERRRKEKKRKSLHCSRCLKAFLFSLTYQQTDPKQFYSYASRYPLFLLITSNSCQYIHLSGFHIELLIKLLELLIKSPNEMRNSD
jgi:threonine/homoserine/homoserine lactone efflux protein